MRARVALTPLLATLLLFASAALPRIALATPSLDGCTGVLHLHEPASEGVVVDTPGVWCLDQDLVTDVDAVDGVIVMITVAAEDVTIDCRGHRIEFLGNADVSRGVSTFDYRHRTVIRNCDVRGFSNAIAAGGADYLIEDNLVQASRPSLYGDGTAIQGYGTGTIRNNRIHDAISLGIGATDSAQVTGNLIDGVSGTSDWSEAIGIEVQSADAAEIRGNTIRGLSSGEASQIFGVIVDSQGGSAPSHVIDNVLVHDGSIGPIGIFCPGQAHLIDNVIDGFYAPLVSGCVDAGDNDISP
ncbi:MAG: right-handed parallel beta-helix repeat-containing protein [Arenimonas sp.]